MRFYAMIFMAFISLAQANEEKIYEPANFKTKDGSFKSSIKFPASIKKSGADGTVVISCDASISRTGKFLANFCFQKDSKFFPYVVAINRAADAGTLEPAKLNGVAQVVWFQYFVTFTKKGNNTLVEVFPNSGLQVDTYGLDYTSPQRYKEDSGNFASGCGTAYANTLLVKAIIGKDGKTKNVSVEGKDVSEKCIQNLKNDFAEQEFIPAFYKGNPVDAYYTEDVFNRFRTDIIR